MSGEGYSSSMPPRFIFFIIAVLTLTLSPEIPATSASVAKIQIQAITDSKPGEVEVTFLSQGSKSPKSLITSYQIVAKPVGASGLVFSKSYNKKVSGYIAQKVSPLSPGVDYIFTLTQRSVDKKVTRSTPYAFTTEPTSPGAPRITSASATDSDEAVIFFDAPKDDGGTPILSYTVTANPGQIITTSNQQVAGSITALGLTKATRYTFTITAQNLYGRSEPSLTSPPVTTLAQKIVRSSTSSTTSAPTLAAPAFTLSNAAETRTVNTAATGFTTTSTGGAIASFAINTTPPGMSFNTTTGALTGTPNTVATATNYTITATNASGSATQTFRLTVAAVVYTVGQTGPGGGTVFYVATTSFSCGPTLAATCTYLEAAPSGWNTGADPSLTWATNVNNNRTTTVPAPGAIQTAIGTGYQNSNAIVAQTGNVAASSAAVAARAYRGNSLTDWYLPSRDELNQMCKWARGITGDALTTLTTVCTGGTSNSGSSATGFVDNRYWSSTEFARNSSEENIARGQNFDGGSQDDGEKSDIFFVRPVRAF
jgi:hypothetical protein